MFSRSESENDNVDDELCRVERTQETMGRFAVNLPIQPLFARRNLVAVALGVVVVVSSAQSNLALGDSAQAEPGASIFRGKCANCHGANGQGVADGHDEPLHGDKSIDELARLIERTMPEEEPETCVGDEARQVADYIYNEFYSPAARKKNRIATAPRVELTRLTVPQYRNALADLIGQFTPTPRINTRRRRGRQPPDDAPRAPPEPGLRAQYYQSKGMSKADKLQQDRVDRSIDFDFEQQSPVEGITADQFSIIWQGTLLAGDTGYYEFRVRTENGARLYLNSDSPERRRKLRDDSSVAGQAALIDAWVSSGEMREPTARVFLLGGRRYPLRLEFFKYKEKTASIRFQWKPPHGAWSVLDQDHLNTAPAARVFVVDTPFSADDRSLGYERGSSVSRQWHAATNSGAIAAAAEVVNRLPLLARFDESSPPGREESPSREEQLRDFVARFASVAFRRPLTSDEKQFFRVAPFDEAPSLDAAVRRAVLLILNSPHFLYTDLTPVGQEPSQHAIASRLAFALWDSIPDESLFEAASNGRLNSVEQIEAQARRMIASPRARAKMHGFFDHWLELGERDLAKDKAMFPEFDEAIIADLRRSLELFIEQVVWSEPSDYRQLLLADYLILNERLRGLYETERQDDFAESDATESAENDSTTVVTDSASAVVEAEAPVSSEPLAEPEHVAQSEHPETPEHPATPEHPVHPEPEFQLVAFSPDRRAGVLTHPYLLSAFAYHNNTSPIHRGVFLTRNIVGRGLNPPPMAVAFKNDEFSPDLTMREKITELTRDSACMSCHQVINPLGFALENFDAVGRWRTSDNNKPVDTKSEYTTAEGQTLNVTNARDVANFAVNSESAHRAFVTQVFQQLVKQNPSAYGADVIGQLRLEFAEDDFNIQNLWARIATLAAAQGHAATPEPEPKL